MNERGRTLERERDKGERKHRNWNVKGEKKNETGGKRERGEVTVRRKKRRRRNGTSKGKNRGNNRRRGSSVGGTALPHCHLCLQRRSRHCERTRAAPPPRSQCREGGENDREKKHRKKHCQPSSSSPSTSFTSSCTREEGRRKRESRQTETETEKRKIRKKKTNEKEKMEVQSMSLLSLLPGKLLQLCR